jgi:ketosteroid isomerase-like protein
MTSDTPSNRSATTIRRLGLAALVAAAIAAATAMPAQADIAATARNEAIVRYAFQRWAGGDNVFQQLLAPDVVWTIPGSGPVAGTYRGLQDFVERASAPLMSRLATPLVPELRHIWAVGDRVTVRFNASATTTGGRPYRNQFVWLFRMKDGKVAEAEAFLDLVAYQQVLDTNAPLQR